jgi:acylglycerol lipase
MASQPEIDFWDSPSGLRFRRLWWRKESPQATLIIHHGHGEHGGRYQTLADGLVDLPVDIQTWDCRGHGESQGARGDVEGGLDGYIDDLEAIMPTLLERSGTDKAFLLGHSMGGAAIAGLIFSSPALLIPRTAVVEIKLLIGKVLGKVVPTLTLPTGLSADGISTVPEEVERYREDPLIHDKISARLGVSLVGDAEVIPLAAGRITLPVLAYHGTDDPICDIEGTRALVRGLGTDEVTFLELEGYAHETHHESAERRAKVFQAIKDFITPRLST